MSCPTQETWLLFLTGELVGEARDEVVAHTKACGPCRADLSLGDALERATTPTSDGARLVDRVMRATEAKPRRLGRPLVALAAGLALVAAAGWLARRAVPAELTPRGGAAPHAWQHRVAAELRAADAVQQTVKEHTALPTTTRWALWYRNAETQRPLYLLAYVVDARGEVHWLTPAYETAGREPPPTALRSTQHEQLLDEVVQFDASEGPATLVTAISPAPASVLELDAVGADTLQHLERQLPDAVVWRRQVTLTLPGGAP